MKVLINETQIKNILNNKKSILNENLIKSLLIEEAKLLIEKELMVGNSLKKKLLNIDKPYAVRLLDFLTSNQISDDVKFDKVDYTPNDNKTISVFYKNNEGKFNDKGNSLSIGKFIQKIGLKLDDFKGYEIDDLISHLKKGSLEDFRVVEGDDILWAYFCENYDEGETMGSCMRYESSQAFLELYSKNPNKVKCLVLINPANNKVKGRALLWELDSGVRFMDKIYVTRNEYTYLFNQWAENNGAKISIDWEVVTLDETDFRYYPYLDTLKYFNKTDGTLKNYKDDYDFVLEDSDGGYQDNLILISYGTRSGERSTEDDLFFLDYTTPSETIQGYAHYDDIMFIDDTAYLNEHCLQLYDGKWVFEYDDSAIYIELNYGLYAGEYADMNETVQLNIDYYGDETWVLLKETVTLYEGHYGSGEYALEEDTTAIMIDDEEVNVFTRDLEQFD